MSDGVDDDNPTTGLAPRFRRDPAQEEVLRDRICCSAAFRYEEDRRRHRRDLVSEALEKDLPSFFDCNICLEVAGDPVLTPCGHLFCWSCLYLWLHVGSDESECPVCEAEVKEAGLIPVYCRGGSKEAEKKRWEVELGLRVPPRPRPKRVESLRQSSHVGMEEAISRVRSRANILRQWIRTSGQARRAGGGESEEVTQLGRRTGVLQDQGSAGPSNAVGGHGRQRAAVENEASALGLPGAETDDISQFLNGGENDGERVVGGLVGDGRRESSSILGRILNPYHWFGWQRPTGLAQSHGPLPLSSPSPSTSPYPSSIMFGTSVGAFHANPSMMGNDNVGLNRQFSENGLVVVRESTSSTETTMPTQSGRVDNVSELDYVASPSAVDGMEGRGRRRRGRRNDESLRYLDLSGEIPPASRRRRAS